MFNIEWVDLNGDGLKDLLVTSQGDSGSGRVLAYEQPKGSGAWALPGAVWTKVTYFDTHLTFTFFFSITEATCLSSRLQACAL